MKSIFIIATISTTACTSTLGQVNKDLSSLNNALAGNANTQATMQKNSKIAQISSEQTGKIDLVLNTKTNNKQRDLAILEAKSTITGFIKTNSCINNYNGSVLNIYAAPGKAYPNFNYIGAPMQLMKYHDKSTCVSVLRIQGWEMPAKNVLRFEVVYVSDSSGESTKGLYEIVKQSSGEWLFNS